MNVDTTNYKHYRLTNHGGRSYQLFNRESDDVWDIPGDVFSFIKSYSDPFLACQDVDNAMKTRAK